MMEDEDLCDSKNISTNEIRPRRINLQRLLHHWVLEIREKMCTSVK